MNHPLFVKAAVLAALATPLMTAAAERLNVRTGLWEIKSVMQISGTVPLPKELRDKLTPQQLEKMAEQAQAAAAKGPARETSRECITEKDLERPFDSADAQECRQTSIKTTRTSQEIRLTCDGERPGTGVLKISAPTPEAMSGTLDLKMGAAPDVFAVTGTLNGRWLSADCGDEADANDADDDAEPVDDSEEEEE